MIRFIFYGFLIYLLYKLIFELVIPVGKATSRVKEQMRQMKQQQEAQQSVFRQKQAEKATTQSGRNPQGSKDKDYIDFEEVK